jgi:hypothetical protein
MSTTDTDRARQLPPLLVQALHMVTQAEASSVCLRLTGSLGVRSHCNEHAELFELYGREQYQLRAKLGTRVPWYQEVEDVTR